MSLCFPASKILNSSEGSLQFWLKNPGSDGGIWELKNLNSTQKLGAFRFKNTTNNTDTVFYEVFTDAAVTGQTSRSWRDNSDWHFLVFNWRQTQFRTNFNVYLDGLQSTSVEVFGKIFLNSSTLICLGSFANKPYSHASFDELKVFSSNRTSLQVIDDFWQHFSGCPAWPSLWRNPFNPFDVTRDTVVDKFDALYILAAIESDIQFDFLTCPEGQLPALAYDVNGNNTLSESDSQSVVNNINLGLPLAERLDHAKLKLITQGDADANGYVTLSDYLKILRNIGLTVEPFTMGDVNGDTLVDATDKNICHKYLSFSPAPRQDYDDEMPFGEEGN